MFLLTISVHTTLHLVTRAVSPKNSVRKMSSATPSTRAGPPARLATRPPRLACPASARTRVTLREVRRNRPADRCAAIARRSGGIESAL